MTEDIESYFVFADDHQIYGPANLTLLQEWARDGLISAETWIFAEKVNGWKKSKQMVNLKGFLAKPIPPTEAFKGGGSLTGGQLRRIRLFSNMTDEQAEKFVNLLEKTKIRAFQAIVRQGEHGDSMFLILDGEARVSLRTQDKEEVIATLKVGDFFGEMALIDAGPRSADVTANKDCTLLQLSKANLETLMAQHPDLAVIFLFAMNRYLGGRVRQTNERFAKAQLFARGTTGQVTAPTSMQWKK